MPNPAYRRVLVKLSGEALQGPGEAGLHGPTLVAISNDIAEARRAGFEVAVVVGGGNFFRGVKGTAQGIDRVRGDSIGMLGTVMNALAIEGALVGHGCEARAMSAVAMPTLCDTYERNMARRHIEAGRVVVLGGGTGNPLFTTDTAAALRAVELSCDALLKATNVDGVYTADPKLDRTATRYERLTHDEAIAKDLKVMDTAAFALARESRLPILVFSIQEPGAITAVLTGKGRFTAVVP
ncbi:UMP kinase [Terrarubrum flagellatum]|uniref:UMP kinase n=1 Tax=Terrirubrum flagellatum TaxID=2895980 RepID=UPI003144F5F1